jgi:hypothetical protein
MDQQIFLTLVRSPQEKFCARVLIESIRAFGGAIRDCPVWIFETYPCDDLAEANTQIFPLCVPANVRDYLFADKVFACAQAEAMTSSRIQSLICVDPVFLFVNPPALFDLGNEFDAAVRPAHIRNIGLRANDPLDEFWRTIYAAVGARDLALTVESFVDAQHLRAYFNTHAFAVNPNLGLCARWRDIFASLIGDADFQTRACADKLHQIFLFQAIFSALLATSLDTRRIRILPPTYNYPYNLHTRVPRERRARALNDLVCFTYENRTIHPAEMTDIQIDDALEVWLNDALDSANRARNS